MPDALPLPTFKHGRYHAELVAVSEAKGIRYGVTFWGPVSGMGSPCCFGPVPSVKDAVDKMRDNVLKNFPDCFEDAKLKHAYDAWCDDLVLLGGSAA